MNSAAARRLASLSELACLVADGSATTRSALVPVTGLSRAAIAQRVDLLIARGLLVETEPAATDRGRPPLTLDLASEAAVVAGVDLGATHSRVALLTLGGHVLAEAERQLDINDGPAAVLGGVSATIGALLAEVGRPAEHLRAIGVGVPGPVEASTGTVIRPPIMQGWDGYRVPAFFEDRYAAPVLVDNDVNVMAFGEYAYRRAGGDRLFAGAGTGSEAGSGALGGTGAAVEGANPQAVDTRDLTTRGRSGLRLSPGVRYRSVAERQSGTAAGTAGLGIFSSGGVLHRRPAEHLLYVKVGTGIGCGIVSGGVPHRGASGAAGDIGHIRLPGHDDVLCHCGNTGCVEAVASGAAIAAALCEAGIPAAGAKDVVRLVSEGHPAARRQVRLAGQRIGEVLASLVSFHNPDTIVIGGILAQLHEDLLADVRGVIYRRALPLATRSLAIETSVLGERAGVLGAARLATRHLLSPHGIGEFIGDV